MNECRNCKQVAQACRQLAANADKTAAKSDDEFDHQARDGARGRALAYRHAAELLERGQH
jgi:hypothetical protein